MTQQTLIALDPSKLDAIAEELRRLNARLDAVEMQPKPEWVTIQEYANIIGKSKDTVNRRIRAGRLQTKDLSGTRMVRVNQDA